MENLKHCYQCGIDKPRSDFTPRKQSHDGLRPECRKCRNARQFKDWRKNLEKNRAHHALLKRKRYAADPEKGRNQTRTWREKHPYKRVRPVLTDKEKIERKKANRRASDIRCHDRIIQRNRNRRATQRAAKGKHTLEDIALLMKKQRAKCAHPWCRKSLKTNCNVDHIIALARGGSNDRQNLQLLCPTCNQKKHAKHPIDFAQENGMLL